MKICSRCHEARPLSEFHRNACGKDGRLTYCKDCKVRRMKTCKDCGKTKEIKCFHKNPAMSDGHVNQCKECKKAQDRARYEHIRSLPTTNDLLQGWGR